MSFAVPTPSTKVKYYLRRIDNWIVDVLNQAV